jgi:predicted ribosomally synthesized peptide with nif11-like leader
MSQDQLKAFLEKVEADAALQEMLKTAANPEAVVGIAKEAGFEISEESLMALRELSDEELEQAAGGMFGSGWLFANGFPPNAGASWNTNVKLPGFSDNTQNNFGVTY